ncbi:hypothetical protein Tco_0715446 [Tanacetum coccineum]
MRTRSQSRNSNRQQQQVNPTFVEPFNLVEPIENQAPLVVTMDDTRTMAQLLEATTVGYEDAIVVPEITAEKFELITNGDIGNGKAGGMNDGQSTVVFPDDMLIQETDYDVGDEKEYESLDSVCLADDDSNFDDSIYTTEFLNGLRMSAMIFILWNTSKVNECVIENIDSTFSFPIAACCFFLMIVLVAARSLLIQNDTEFLNFTNVDDDHACDYMPNVEATRVIDNSGWSSRTKSIGTDNPRPGHPTMWGITIALIAILVKLGVMSLA